MCRFCPKSWCLQWYQTWSTSFHGKRLTSIVMARVWWSLKKSRGGLGVEILSIIAPFLTSFWCQYYVIHDLMIFFRVKTVHASYMCVFVCMCREIPFYNVDIYVTKTNSFYCKSNTHHIHIFSYINTSMYTYAHIQPSIIGELPLSKRCVGFN